MTLRTSMSAMAALAMAAGAATAYADGACNKGFQLAPWSYDFSRTYSNIGGQEARDAAFAAVSVDAQAAFAQKQPQIAALQARLGELGVQEGAAIQKGDLAQAEKINAEVERVTAEFQRVLNEGDANEQLEAAAAKINRDIEFTINVTVNPRVSPPLEHAEIFSVPGARSAERWNELEDSHYDGNAIVTFGAFKVGENPPFLDPVARSGAPMPGVHALEVRIWSDVDRLSSVIEATNFAALAAPTR